MSGEKLLFELMSEFCGDDQAVGGVFVTDHMEFETGYRCFTSDGVSFDVIQEYVCEPNEVSEYDGVDSDGHSYEFRDGLDGFKNVTLDEATTMLKEKADVYI